PLDAPVVLDTEPLEQRVRLAAPRARGDLGRRRAGHADVGEVEVRQCVEQARLARAGPADERDDGVVDTEREALAHPREPRGHLLDDAGVDAVAPDLESALDLARPVLELGGHRSRARPALAVQLGCVHVAALSTARRSRRVAAASSARCGVASTPTTASSPPCEVSSVRSWSWARTVRRASSLAGPAGVRASSPAGPRPAPAARTSASRPPSPSAACARRQRRCSLRSTTASAAARTACRAL